MAIAIAIAAYRKFGVITVFVRLTYTILYVSTISLGINDSPIVTPSTLPIRVARKA